jgi:pimeloyl-ACP methyl ester carboxylesterase
MSRPPAPVRRPEPYAMDSRSVEVDGLRTHWLEGGSGPTLVLLHSGEFGSCAELSWEYNFAHLAASHHVIAPDWLGYGQTAKVHDFETGGERRMRHMVRFLATIGVGAAHFVGNSMGATVLLRDAASTEPQFPALSIVAISGGGNIPDNEARRALLGYDCTVESMRAVLDALFPSGLWSADEHYVQRRYQESLRPGAWECAAAARLKSPALPPRGDFGGQDTTPYQDIRVPVLLVAGQRDALKESGYGRELAKRIPRCELLEVDGAGHCAHIENPKLVSEAITRFVNRVESS